MNGISKETKVVKFCVAAKICKVHVHSNNMLKRGYPLSAVKLRVCESMFGNESQIIGDSLHST